MLGPVPALLDPTGLGQGKRLLWRHAGAGAAFNRDGRLLIHPPFRRLGPGLPFFREFSAAVIVEGFKVGAFDPDGLRSVRILIRIRPGGGDDRRVAAAPPSLAVAVIFFEVAAVAAEGSGRAR